MFDWESIHLRCGAGKGDPKDGLCLMQMVDYFDGRNAKLTDHPQCACPVLSEFGIRLNDNAPSQTARDELWPLVFRLVGSRDKSMGKVRAEFLVIEVAKGPLAEAWEIMKRPEIAADYRTCQSMADAKRVSLKAKKAANASAYAACADYAATAAYAAYATAAYAAAAYAAAAAADAAAYAAAVYAADATARLKIWRSTKDVFARAIALGKHGEADPICIAPRLYTLKRELHLAE